MNAKGFATIIGALVEAEVEFVLVGGLAAIALGATRATYDVDVVYNRDEDNLTRIENCLREHHPYLRDAPPGLPFRFDTQTLRAGMNFTLTTDLGALDLLGEVAGNGSWETLHRDCQAIEIFGYTCLSVTIDQLIHLKRSAGRPKDLEAIAELESIRELDGPSE